MLRWKAYDQDLFDSHLIEADPFGRGLLLNGCFQHAAATGILFDGDLMAPTREMSHSSIEGLRPTPPKACGSHPGGRFPKGGHIQGLAY